MNILYLNLIALVSGYLIGSVLFAVLICCIVKGKDIRTLGTGNPGASNAFKVLGPFWGILTGLMDALKAVIPMIIGLYILEFSVITIGFIGIGVIIGHDYPLYFKLKGGRGIGSIMGAYIVLIPIELLASFIIVPGIVCFFIKKRRSSAIPFLILIISSLASLFANHPVELKMMVAFTGLTVTFFNRSIPVFLKNINDEGLNSFLLSFRNNKENND